MDNRTEVREFLMSRRVKLTPEQVSLPVRTGAWTADRHATTGN